MVKRHTLSVSVRTEEELDAVKLVSLISIFYYYRMDWLGSCTRVDRRKPG